MSVNGAAASVVCSGVRHVYRGGKVALDGVDLTIGTGLFGLLGPNGAGKSTLMRIICTLLVPTAGAVTAFGHDVVKNRQAIRARLGYLPQEFGAWRLMRVEEAVETLALLSGMTDAKVRKTRVRAVIEQVGLGAVGDRKVKALSGGMRRRLGIAQALVHDPSLIVVDEPTVGLDPEERLRFRQTVAQLAQDRVILLSTHIVADLGGGCRDLAIIDQGQVIYRGGPEALLEQAEGRVFETVVAVGAEDRLAGHEIVSRVREGVGVRVRAVRGSSSAMPDYATVVTNPTLEESYLAFMMNRGRADAALEGHGE